MRLWSRALAASLLLAAPGARAAKRAVVDPETALLVLAIQQSSVELLREDLAREAARMELGAARAILAEFGGEFAARVKAGLTADSDILEDYRRLILAVDPAAMAETDRLVAEIRRAHDLKPGPPLTRVPKPKRLASLAILEEEGVGADVAAALQGALGSDEPAAHAERGFGAAGPKGWAAGAFLRERGWDVDFYLGAFDDLHAHYRALGYRRVYRLRAPYVSDGRQAFVLASKPGLRPRLVYCAFDGSDLFAHTRARWAVFAGAAPGCAARTLTCPATSWTPPGVLAMRALLATVPYAADTVIAGYAHLFESGWKERLLGVYENEHWRLAYYRTGPTVSVTVSARRADFGEILAAALAPLVARGAARVYYAGPATRVDERRSDADPALPTEFVSFTGKTIPFQNALRRGKEKPAVFAGLPSPLYATREWLDGARRRGVAAFDEKMAHLAEAAASWARVECGIIAVLANDPAGKESAQRRFRDAVLAKIGEAR